MYILCTPFITTIKVIQSVQKAISFIDNSMLKANFTESMWKWLLNCNGK